ncbi:unnamed protein product [Linum tenue]|uniref:Leucine-rich repeat-containing N-terminal plant-type domain-containing protein n=1 Tax=Linum tenue TaxID=586396 RepID=A0AAV0HWL9_9ROSI|nr:unnamed protein product [Linum tenue]
MARNQINMIPISALIILLTFLLPQPSLAESPTVRSSLIRFMDALRGGGELSAHPPPLLDWGWNATSDPCTAKWAGILCDQEFRVVAVTLDGLELRGVLDARTLCAATPLLAALSLRGNGHIHGPLPPEIAECKSLTNLVISGNRFEGAFPRSLGRMMMTGLREFRAQDNQFSGPIPEVEGFGSLVGFDVSNNNLTGPIPGGLRTFSASAFAGNQGLCGPPLPGDCPFFPAPAPAPVLA